MATMTAARKPKRKPTMSQTRRDAIGRTNRRASAAQKRRERDAINSLTQSEYDQVYGRDGEERINDCSVALRQRKLALFLVELPPEERAILSILRQGFVCSDSGGFAHTPAREAEIHFAHAANLLERRTPETSQAMAAAVLLEMARVLGAEGDAVPWIRRVAAEGEL